MRYFCIMSGLRGCYMPDSVHTVAVKTRRALKEHLIYEYDFTMDFEGAPMRRREIAAAAAALWRRSHKDRDSYLSTVIETTEGCGLQVNPISLEEYLAAQSEE